jgi:hypothetical protein
MEDDSGIRQAVARALDHGATSGADLLSGFLHTMQLEQIRSTQSI